MYVCVRLCIELNSAVICCSPDQQRFKASTAPSRFGRLLQILVKDDQCIKDFIQKKARQGNLWVILKSDSRQCRQQLYFLQHLLSSTLTSSVLYDVCGDTARKHRKKQNISLKNTPKLGRYRSVTISRNLLRLPHYLPH